MSGMKALMRPTLVAAILAGVFLGGGIVFAATNTTTQTQQQQVQKTNLKCVNGSEYTIRILDPQKPVEVTGTQKRAPQGQQDQQGCSINLCVPSSLATTQTDKKEVCTKKEFSGDEELKNANLTSFDGARDAFQSGILKDLRDRVTDQGALNALSAQLRGLPQGLQTSINDAFKEQISTDITNQQSQVSQAEQALRNLQQCMSDGPECSSQAEITEAQRKLQLEKETLENLKKSQVALEPSQKYNCPSLNPADNCGAKTPDTPQPCPTGQVRVGGECKANDSRFPQGPGGTEQTGPGSTQTTSGSNPFGNILSQLARSLLGQQQQPQAQNCPTDPQQYQQYQQQYQQQLQQYNYQLQQYNYQQQYSQYYGGQNSFMAAPPPAAPVQCKQVPNTGGGQCTDVAQPQSACASGWQPVRAQGQCVTSWQCGGAGVAQISCQPELADVGMKIAISYGCSSGTAVGQGFTTSGNSGSAEVTLTSPGAGISTVNYGLTCTNQGTTESKQCTVRINKPSLIFVANPKVINSGERSALGWVTAGIESCVVSSPDNATFTSENAGNAKKSGTVYSPTLTADTTFVLSCTTLSGGTRTASTTIDVR